MNDFEEVYRLYFRDVYRYALSISRSESMAEEITQETFFKALKGLDSFDGRCRLYVWLCQIAKNTYFSMREKEKRREEDAQEEFDDGIESRLVAKESALEIHRALHSLSEPYKEVFSLRTFGELSFAQIAMLFGKTESWARVTYHRAKLQIKEKLL
ncbi:MAG: RNA polymerase sigma factor [Ruminococcaceae bacterium]|nr:RNA polymerase sigma factor [Oscillospiraceae bacterium]